MRPSSIPYLLRCGGYVSSPGSGWPAQRGTEIDSLFRRAIQKNLPIETKLSPLDLQSIQWAVAYTLEIADGHQVLTDEKDCHLEDIHESMPNGGTADAIIPALQTTIDLKSGREYDYEGQMASYALGAMNRYFADEWKCIVLYCDARKPVYYSFKRADCIAIIDKALANSQSGQRSINGYCKWCSNFDHCAETARAADAVTSVSPFGMQALERDPRLAAQFLSQMGIAKELETRIKANIKSENRSIPGYAIAADSERVTVTPEKLWPYLARLGDDAYLLLGDASGKSVRDALKKSKIKLTEEEEKDLFTINLTRGALRKK